MLQKELDNCGRANIMLFNAFNCYRKLSRKEAIQQWDEGGNKKKTSIDVEKQVHINKHYHPKTTHVIHQYRRKHLFILIVIETRSKKSITNVMRVITRCMNWCS